MPHRLQAEGLIEAVRAGQQGDRPARAVYAITAEGRRELQALRTEAKGEARLHPGPVDLALAMCADPDADTLHGFCADRRQELTSRAAFFCRARERAWPDRGAADDLIIDHAIARIEAELRWHDMVLDRLGKVAADNAPGGAP